MAAPSYTTDLVTLVEIDGVQTIVITAVELAPLGATPLTWQNYGINPRLRGHWADHRPDIWH